MTGLKGYRRDPGLPERLGDARLVPPDPGSVLAWARRLLVDGGPDAPAPRSATWEFARWKPGVSITCVYGIELDDGAAELVALKRYRTDKAAHLLAREDEAAAGPGPDGRRLHGRAFVDEATAIWTPGADRELPGLARLLDPRRPARWLEEAGVVPPRSVRRRRTACRLVRYKPERRAVARLDLSLRDGPRRHASFAVRVLPVAEAQRVLDARRALARAAGDERPRVVPLCLEQAALGILLEPWLDVTTFADDAFHHAALAGRALAALHEAPLWPRRGGALPAALPTGGADARALLERFHVDASGLAEPADEPRTWTHGDLHPDQVAVDADGAPLLLDLDRLAPGDPRRDLASWIADHLARDPRATLDGAAAPLLAGYRTGGAAPPAPGELAPFVADELVQRAAAAIRRLEHGAMERARDLVGRARDVAAPGRSGAPAAPVEHPVRLEAALAALAEHLRDPRAADRVARADVARTGELFLTLDPPAPGGAATWLRYDRAGLTALAPAGDARLPLAARLRDPGEAHVLAWRPGRRLVLRDGDEVLKGHRPRRFPAAVAAHLAAVRANAAGGFRVPEVRAVLEPEAALAFERLDGAPLAVAPRGAGAFAAVGARLRAMQAQATDGLAPHGPRDELGVLERWRARLASVGVDPPEGWEPAARALAAAAADLPAAPAVPCHRDLHDGQLLALAGGEGIGCLDFDLLCAADPALDPANLLAHLRLRALQGLAGADDHGAARCGAALLDGLDRTDDAGFHRNLGFYAAAAHLRLALVYALRPRWRRLGPDLTRLAAEALAGAAHEVRR